MTSVEKKTRTLNAKLEAVLFETDAIDIALLVRNQGTGVQHYIACAILDDFGCVDYYFVVFVGRSHLLKYFSEQCDLRFLFTYSGRKKYYTTKRLVPHERGTTPLLEYEGEVTEDLLPDSRFFASSHTSKYGITDVVRGEQRLLIDGQWDMQEFGQFYQKFADLYSFQEAINCIESGSDSKKLLVQSAFRSKPFRGGSSYVGFFGDLFDLIPRAKRPALEGIEYHSPGYVDLRGEDSVLDAVKEGIQSFLENAEDIEKAHDDLKSFMSKSKLLLVTGSAPLPKPEILNELRLLSVKFFESLPVDGKEHLFELTNGNLIVQAKVGLALYRRLRMTSVFFAQGRLSFT